MINTIIAISLFITGFIIGHMQGEIKATDRSIELMDKIQKNKKNE